MERFKIALCDEDAFYRKKFAEYIIKHKAKEIELTTYSKQDEYEEDLEKDRFHLIIAGKGFETAFEQEIKKDILYLCEQEIVDANADREDVFREDALRHKHILKYQSMENILHEIYVLIGKTQKQPNTYGLIRKLEVIGVCSPVHHEMQSFFSMLYAINLAQQKKVLYFNFLEMWGFKQILGQQGETDMGDVLLHIHNKTLTPQIFWRCIYEMHGISVILPFENPQNVRLVMEKEIQTLLSFVEKNTDFEVVVIDMSLCMEEMAACMKECNIIFALNREGFFYECQQQAFFTWMKQRGGEAIEEKIRMLTFPYTAKNMRGGEQVVSQLQWSEFGDFVRKCM